MQYQEVFSALKKTERRAKTLENERALLLSAQNVTNSTHLTADHNRNMTHYKRTQTRR